MVALQNQNGFLTTYSGAYLDRLAAGTVENVLLGAEARRLVVEHVVCRVIHCPCQEAEIARLKAELLAGNIYVSLRPTEKRSGLSELFSICTIITGLMRNSYKLIGVLICYLT